MLKTHWKKIAESLFKSYNNSINFFSLEYWLEFIVREREREVKEKMYFGWFYWLSRMLMENLTFMMHFPLFIDAVTFKPIQQSIDEKLCSWSAEFIEWRDTYSIIADFSQRFFNEAFCQFLTFVWFLTDQKWRGLL